MMQSRRVKNLSIIGILICSVMVVSACARHEIKLHAVSYNKAIEDFGNKQILINAVRASKRYPMYFSAVGNMSGKGIVDGSLQTQFPFTVSNGRHIELPNFNVNPTANYSSGLSTIAISNLNTKEFQDGLFDEIDNKLFKQFFDNNWPKGVMFNVFIHKIKINPDLDVAIGGAVYRFCMDAFEGDPDSRKYKRCVRLQDDIYFYRDYCKREYRDFKKGNPRYFNAGDHECDQRRFQIFISELRILGVEFRKKKSKKSKSSVATFSPKKKTKTVENAVDPATGNIVINRGSGKVVNVVKTITYEEVDTPKTTFGWFLDSDYITVSGLDEDDFQVHLRSPHAMIIYLGDLIRAQNFIDDVFMPTTIYGDEFLRVPLFVVSRGILGKAVVGAISVKHERSVYYIPRPRYGDYQEARSLQVLDLINQVIVHQTKRSDIPKSSTVQLVGN